MYLQELQLPRYRRGDSLALCWGIWQAAPRITRDDLEEQELIALLGPRLTPCAWNIMYQILAHPFMSDTELAAFLHLQQKSVRCSLYGLHRLDCLEPVETSVGKRWPLRERGLRLIAAANHVHVRRVAVIFGKEAERGTSTAAQRGEDWLLQHIQHTAGIYGFFARLAQAARQEGEQALCWWETGAACERRYRIQEQWYISSRMLWRNIALVHSSSDSG